MAHSEKKWAEAKVDYENGSLTIEKLSKKHGISEGAIVDRIRDYEWVKGKNKPLIEQTIAEKNIEAFAEAHCEHKDVVKRVAEVIMDEQEDKRLILSYVQEYNKMCGALAPAKKEVTGKDGSNLIPPGTSIEDIRRTIKEIVSDEDNSGTD